MGKHMVLAGLLGVLAVTAAAAPAVKHFAVLEFSGPKDLKPEEVTLLSDAARTGVRDVLPNGQYVVVTRESMLKVLREMGKKDCQEGECEVDTLQNIGADYGLTASVVKVEGIYVVTLKLFDATSGNLLASADVEGKKLLDLRGKVKQESATLVQRGLLQQPVVEPVRDTAVAVPDVVQTGPRRKGKTEVTAAVGNLVVEARPREGTRLDLTDPKGNKVSSGWQYKNDQAAVGTWNLLARAPGFEDLRRDISVPADETTVEKVDLKALGNLSVTGTPRGALVKVTGPNAFKDESGLPWEMEGLPSGTYHVEVRRESYEPLVKDVVVESGLTANVPVALTKAVARGNCPDGMVYIPGGTFWMGSPDGEGNPDEHPRHQVTLSPYCMDKTEVTVSAFAACVAAGKCDQATAYGTSGLVLSCTAGAPGKERHPINCVTWARSQKYCESKGGRLPSEAEWELAARGLEGRKYPWGSDQDYARRLNVCGGDCAAFAARAGEQNITSLPGADDGWESTAPVGTFPLGASPYGLLDMGGNVAEWVQDWSAAYSAEAQRDPMGPATGTDRIYRGGSWLTSNPTAFRGAVRYANGMVNGYTGIGFRCVHAP